MNRELIRTSAFVRSARKLVKKSTEARDALANALNLLAQDAFHPRLKTHSLKGELDGCWACSAGYDLRIVFSFAEQDGAEVILLLAVGTHDEVY